MFPATFAVFMGMGVLLDAPVLASVSLGAVAVWTVLVEVGDCSDGAGSGRAWVAVVPRIKGVLVLGAASFCNEEKAPVECSAEEESDVGCVSWFCKLWKSWD